MCIYGRCYDSAIFIDEVTEIVMDDNIFYRYTRMDAAVFE